MIDHSLDASLDIFTESILEAASSMRKTIVRGGSKTCAKAKWFDAECSAKKKEVKECLKSFRKTRENTDYVEYANQRKE